MDNGLVLSFPHMGAYHIPIAALLRTLFPGQTVRPAPVMTNRTIEVGSRYSPDFVCAPFKYNLGNYIEALEAGANVLFQTGMGCRYGYYGELQEQILRDLGYDFRFVCLSRDRAGFRSLYQTARELGSPLSRGQMARALLFAAESIGIMDRFDYYLRENIGFERSPGSFESLRKALLRDLTACGTFRSLAVLSKTYLTGMKRIETERPERPLRVGMVGDLYTLMEPFSNFYVEKQLAESGISVSRAMSVSFLLFGRHDARTLRACRGYLRYTVGANGVDSVAQSRRYAEQGYDGILHVKSFGCIPELNATPALIRLANDYDIPILHLSFDSNTSETGVRTRLEAFSDMIAMRRGKQLESFRKSGR